MSDASGSTTWTHDSRGRILTESKVLTGAGTFNTSWTYNAADLPITMTYPGGSGGQAGEQVTYGYSNRMLLDSVTGTSNYVVSTTYDSVGRIDVRTFGTTTAIKTDYDYYPWTQQGGKLQYIKSGTSAAPTSLQNLEYAYDAVGNVDWIKDWKAGSPQLQDFGYDALDRLTSASATGGTGGLYSNETYTYNSATGNLETKAGVTLSYNDAAHKHAVTNAGSNTYTYDANGNQKKRVVGGQTFALEYNAENQLVKVCQDTSSNGICDTGETVIAQFTYDGDGRQVKAVVGSTTTYYVGSHYEQTGTGTVTKYYFAGAQRVALRSGSTLSYLLGDHLGSTSLTVNTSGAFVGELRYKPWGETRYTSGTTPTNYQYTGQRNEVSLGLYFYNARWYDSALGRFAQADSIIPPQQGVQAWDRFAYTNNNPVRYTDPTGHWIWFAVGAAILATPFVLSSFGIGPDMIGIDVARAVTRGSGDAVVTAGLAVQSQYPWAIVLGGGSGWAGATEDELKGENPYSPTVAVKVIEERIDNALTACGTKCKTATDRLIVAALAQNGTGFDAGDVAELPMSNGTINWDYVMTELGDNPSDGFAKLRQDITNMNFETRLMLKIFMQDLRVLLGHGYVLPDEFEGADLDFIDTLIIPQAPDQNGLPSPI